MMIDEQGPCSAKQAVEQAMAKENTRENNSLLTTRKPQISHQILTRMAMSPTRWAEKRGVTPGGAEKPYTHRRSRHHTVEPFTLTKLEHGAPFISKVT